MCGFRFKAAGKDYEFEIDMRDHWKSRAGHCSHPLPGLRLHNVCSPICLRNVFEKWLDAVDEKVMNAWNHSARVENTREFGDGPVPSKPDV